MKKIKEWLNRFVSAWQGHDVEKVLGLFADDVEYWETPFVKLSSPGELNGIWEGIREQKDIVISCDVFSKDGDKYAVRWDLEYKNEQDSVRKLSGVYLIGLDQENRCNYFLQCGELKN